jgi:hypothetical protein
MPRARRAILFRVLLLIPMFMLGRELFYFAQGERANHWLAKDGKPVSAVITEAHSRRAYSFRYVVDGKEYIGHGVRAWEDEKIRRLAAGEQISVVMSESHPWISDIKPRQTSWAVFPIVVAMTLLECLCFVALISPRSLDVFKAKQQQQQQPPNLDIRRFIRLVLLQAQKDGATEIVVGIASPSGVPIRYKVEDAWQEMPPFPSHIRPDVVSELVRMAGFHAGQIPREGVLDESLGDIRLRWMVAMTTIDGEFLLKRIDN